MSAVDPLQLQISIFFSSEFVFTEPRHIPGHVLFDHCGTFLSDGILQLSDDRMNSWDIEAAEVIPWFPSRPKVSWVHSLNAGSNMLLPNVSCNMILQK